MPPRRRHLRHCGSTAAPSPLQPWSRRGAATTATVAVVLPRSRHHRSRGAAAAPPRRRPLRRRDGTATNNTAAVPTLSPPYDCDNNRASPLPPHYRCGGSAGTAGTTDATVVAAAAVSPSLQQPPQSRLHRGGIAIAAATVPRCFRCRRCHRRCRRRRCRRLRDPAVALLWCGRRRRCLPCLDETNSAVPPRKYGADLAGGPHRGGAAVRGSLYVSGCRADGSGIRPSQWAVGMHALRSGSSAVDASLILSFRDFPPTPRPLEHQGRQGQ